MKGVDEVSPGASLQVSLSPFLKLILVFFQHIILSSHTTLQAMTFTLFAPQVQQPSHNSHENHTGFAHSFAPCDNSLPLAQEYSFSGNLELPQALHTPKRRTFPQDTAGRPLLEHAGEPSYQKMRRVSERTGSYKRSTNNSHKKFICVAKRLLLRLLPEPQRTSFEVDFQELKNSRTYFFIILAHAKLLLSPEQTLLFRKQFLMAMQTKISLYRKEVGRTDNRNFIHFRCDEITDIEFAFTALELYFEGQLEKAVETIYKRDKPSLIKKHQYEQAVQVVKQVEATLALSHPSHSSLHDVIILQQNAAINSLPTQPKHQPYTQHPSQLKPDHHHHFLVNQQEQEGSRDPGKPLLFLQNSYPYYSYFYQVMFPYQITEPIITPFPIDYQFNLMPSDQQLPSFLTSQQLLPKDMAEIGSDYVHSYGHGYHKKEMPLVGKTAESEESEQMQLKVEEPHDIIL